MALKRVTQMCGLALGALKNGSLNRIMTSPSRGHTSHLLICRSISILDDRASMKDHFAQYKGGSVELTKHEDTGIAVIMLNNPEVKNALSGQMMVELHDIITDLETWNSGKGIVLRGAGTNFCSGGDMRTVRQICDPINGAKMSAFMHITTSRLVDLPMISVAAVQGTALGGGAELCTACDFRLMTDDAKIGFVHVKLGVITGWGGGSRLVTLLGKSKALEILGSGKVYDSSEAKKVGLANDILPESQDIEESAMEWLKKFCCWDAAIVSYTKAVVNVAGRSPVDVALTFERECFGELWGSVVHLNCLKKNLKHN